MLRVGGGAAEYYVKTMERTLERGSKYPRSERERIKGILKKGGLKKDKQAQMEARVNILVGLSSPRRTRFCRALHSPHPARRELCWEGRSAWPCSGRTGCVAAWPAGC